VGSKKENNQNKYILYTTETRKKKLVIDADFKKICKNFPINLLNTSVEKMWTPVSRKYSKSKKKLKTVRRLFLVPPGANKSINSQCAFFTLHSLHIKNKNEKHNTNKKQNENVENKT